VTIIPSRKKTISEYPSRFCFRIIFLLRSIIMPIPYLKFFWTFADGIISIAAPNIAYIFADFAIMFLVLSLQDFACFLNREQSFIKIYWLNITLPIVLSMSVLQIGMIYSGINGATGARCLFATLYELFFFGVVLCLIDIPAWIFLKEIDNNDMSGERHKNVIQATLFLFFAILFLIGATVVDIGLIYTKIHNKEVSKILVFVREPMYLIICFTQDLIDWMIGWLVTSMDFSDYSRVESLGMSLIM